MYLGSTPVRHLLNCGIAGCTVLHTRRLRLTAKTGLASLAVERDYLIAGASVVENLQAMRTTHSQNEFNENLRTIPSQILPTKLEQIKPLASLNPDEQRQVWDKAVETANAKVPSGRTVKGIVRQLHEVGFLDRGGYNVLGDVGKHTYLTPVEEGLLSWLEMYYRVDEQESKL